MREERALFARGIVRVAGLDEAGAGAWAGPVCAGAVILPARLPRRAPAIRDSKLLSERQRNEAAAFIKLHAVAWAVGWATPEEIDTINIRRAGALAMRRAMAALVGPDGAPVEADFALVDAFTVPGLLVPQRGIVRGDAKVLTIAAASILAKTARDAFMAELDESHPEYGFAKHKGYGTPAHQQALAEHGTCPMHRLSYAPVKAACIS